MAGEVEKGNEGKPHPNNMKTAVRRSSTEEPGADLSTLGTLKKKKKKKTHGIKGN